MRVSFIYKICLFLIINKSFAIIFNNKNTNSKNNQCIISSKNDQIYFDKDTYISANDFLLNKKLITISPGGFKGFYLLGILTYIKENYNLDNVIYSGASAGAWNALFMCYKGNSLDFVYKLINSNIKTAKSITELEYLIKYKLLSSYKEDEFDLRRLFIGVTTLNCFIPYKNIFFNFENLEDAINCCIASSHIPFVTGGIINKYHDMYTFDGGFSNYPYLETDNFIVHISPNMWYKTNNETSSNIKRNIETIKRFSDFFSISKNNFLELFDDGYQDAKKHKKMLDSIFTSK
jgi:hypothetical protein